MNNLDYMPKVSIIIPAFNASNYLDEAIDSALEQTYPNVEIIVVNDGSRDDNATRNIALKYGKKIVYIEKENGGSSSALNMGIANMTGEWFSWLSHDDLYVPEKLEIQMRCLFSLQKNVLDISKHIFFSASELIDASGKVIRKFNAKKAQILEKKLTYFPHNGYLIAEPTVYNFHGCSCLIHKSAFEDVGAFDEKLRLLNDLDMWFRLYAANYKVHYIPVPLVKGRIHPKQVSKSIGFSYHNTEQDMFWKRSLNWLLENCSEKELLFLFGRNAFLKTRNEDGERAFSLIKDCSLKKEIHKIVYKSRANIRQMAKNIYLKLRT